MQNRYQSMFTHLTEKNQAALIPFVTLGDPNYDLSLSIIDTLIAAGADALELGIPFSDPMADGPTVQAANLRAFAADINLDKCFTLLSQIRNKHPKIPIGILVYANLTYSNGIQQFYQRCAQAGVDAILIPDVPMREAKEFQQAAQALQLQQIFICPPDANTQVLTTLASNCSGYIYLLSRVGVTGTEVQATNNLASLTSELKKLTKVPLIQGFGISSPQQVKYALDNGADGAIVGSALISIIEENIAQPEQMLNKITTFIQQLKAVCYK